MRTVLLAILFCLTGCQCRTNVQVERRSTTRPTPRPPRIMVTKWDDKKGSYVETIHEGWPTVTEEREKP